MNYIHRWKCDHQDNILTAEPQEAGTLSLREFRRKSAPKLHCVRGKIFAKGLEVLKGTGTRWLTTAINQCLTEPQGRNLRVVKVHYNFHYITFGTLCIGVIKWLIEWIYWTLITRKYQGMAVSNTSYKPGTSGNPHGRPPKGYSITDTFREMFDSDPSLKTQLAKKILSKALNGDMTACKLIWGYMDGLQLSRTEVAFNLETEQKNKYMAFIESERERFGL